MSLFFIIILLILNLSSKQINCFSNEENVWETFESKDNKQNEKIPKFTESSQQLYEEGRHRYEVLAKDRDIYGNCWRNAILLLHTNCKQLNDEIQSRLSLAFTNCFLQRSGFDTYPCDEMTDIKECLKNMTDRAFNTYTEFFTHTQSVCFYLQSELWQQNTEITIDRLTQTSINVKNRLEDASLQLEQLNGLQELSISSQIKLNEELISAKNTINEFKSSTSEQRFIVREILDRFIRLQDFVLIEISYGYSLLFFIVLMIVVYLVTTPNRTNEARLWLFVLLIINLFIERLIATYSVDHQLIGLKTSSIVINERIWISRKITLVLMSVLFLWFAITYKDYSFVNYNLLTEQNIRLNNIQNQLNQILRTDTFKFQNNVKSIVCDSDKDYSPNSDSDFTDDSDYSTDNSDVSIETCSTIPIVSSSTPKPKSNNYENIINSAKVENKENSVINTSFVPIVSNNSYSLRPRKAITYTKNGIIDESVDEFTAKVKLFETISRISNRRFETQLQKGFMSDDD